MWKLNHKEGWALKNWYFWTVVLEKTLESPLDCKGIKPVNPKGNQSVLNIRWKDWCWSWNSDTSATWWEMTHWKRPWCWEKVKAEGVGEKRGWNGWMTSHTRWTWVWASSWGWWWTGKPGMLQSVGLQKVVHDWVTELKHWTEHLSKHRMSHAIPINNKCCLPSSHQLLPYPRMCAQRTIMDKGKQNTGARS